MKRLKDELCKALENLTRNLFVHGFKHHLVYCWVEANRVEIYKRAELLKSLMNKMPVE